MPMKGISNPLIVHSMLQKRINHIKAEPDPVCRNNFPRKSQIADHSVLDMKRKENKNPPICNERQLGDYRKSLLPPALPEFHVNEPRTPRFSRLNPE